MCGIFGVVLNSKAILETSQIKEMTTDLLKFSESRGKEATGLALQYGTHVEVIKSPHPAKQFVNSEKYKNLFKNLDSHSKLNSKDPLILLGHSRLVTNGTQKNDKNNQPVVSEDLIGVHNGIIVNHENLWASFPSLNKESDVDTEVFLKIINKYLHEGSNFTQAIQLGFNLIEGAASIALFHKDAPHIILATNTGSLYCLQSIDLGVLIFASEELFLKKLLKKNSFLSSHSDSFVLTQIKSGQGVNLALSPFAQENFSFSLSSFKKNVELQKNPLIYSSAHIPSHNSSYFSDSLKRCSHCVLPETMPFITFDEKGVCSYCLNYQKYTCESKQTLKENLKKYRKDDGTPDCIVAFSGGRDSSYGLHLIKKELNLNPLAMTYDWGVVTDLARRNQARMCGALGVEHILVSANIEQKRLNIKMNLEAWLKRPELGMIPLLMAGDKKFFYYSNKVAKQNNIGLIIFCVNPLEKTEFKSGFSGIKQYGKVIFNQISLLQNLSLIGYYVKNFLSEPKYLNTSLLDTASAYFVSYFMNHPYVQLFDYYRWDEEEINDVLINEYNWETDPTTTTTWRIGDGTAAFYNYVYHHIVGFTENDTFRSNQIREGIITREQAVQLVQVENKPRYQSIEDYLSLVGVDFEKTMKVIDALPKFY